MYNKTFLLVAFFSITTLIACKDKKQEEVVTDDIIPVKVMSLQMDSLQQTINASGQFTTDDETNLSFKNGGIIRKIYVDVGDAVKKGQLLATVDLTEINAMSQQASLGYAKAQRDYERAVNLYKDSVATLEQMQNAKTALDIARQQYIGAGFNQNNSEIRATQSGFVLRRFAQDGQITGPGTPVLQINGAANGNWILKAGVSDKQWSAIAVGDKAVITTDALEGKTFSAKVIKKSEGIDPMSGTFIIHLQITDGDKKGIAAGLFGKAIITPSRTTEAWAIPYDALLDSDKNTGYVFITNDDSTVQKISVQISNVANGKVIINTGLENVKHLIISGSAYLNEDSKIKVLP